jgi:hypothetical protein
MPRHHEPQYDERGRRVWRFGDTETGLMQVCEELAPVLRAYFEASAGLEDLPTTETTKETDQ